MKESNVIADIGKTVTKRDRGYLRAQRLRKIMERSVQAQKANIEVIALGKLAKTSPFSLIKYSGDARRALRDRRSLFAQEELFAEAA